MLHSPRVTSSNSPKYTLPETPGNRSSRTTGLTWATGQVRVCVRGAVGRAQGAKLSWADIDTGAANHRWLGALEM